MVVSFSQGFGWMIFRRLKIQSAVLISRVVHRFSVKLVMTAYCLSIRWLKIGHPSEVVSSVYGNSWILFFSSTSGQIIPYIFLDHTCHYCIRCLPSYIHQIFSLLLFLHRKTRSFTPIPPSHTFCPPPFPPLLCVADYGSGGCGGFALLFLIYWYLIYVAWWFLLIGDGDSGSGWLVWLVCWELAKSANSIFFFFSSFSWSGGWRFLGF